MTAVGQLRNFYPAFRVFVFGVEITNDVISVGVTHADGRAPSTAEIILANKDPELGIDDRYIVTDADIKAMTGVDLTTVNVPDIQPALSDIEAKIQLLQAQAALQATIDPTMALSSQAVTILQSNQASIGTTELAQTRAQIQEQIKAFNQTILDQQNALIVATERTYDMAQRQVLQNLKNQVPDPLKQLVLVTKCKPETITKLGTPTTQKIGGAELIATIQQLEALRGIARRYPFAVGDCIFHSNDPVRIFFRDPRDPAVWYHMFAGFITDWVDDVDANNTKTVTLRCEDVLRDFRYARFTTTPGLIDIDAAATSIDLVLQNFNNDDFRNLSLPDFMFAMTFGFVTSGEDQVLQELGQDPKSLTGTTTYQLIGPKGTTRLNLNKDAAGPFSIDRSMILVFGPVDDNSPPLVVQSKALQSKQLPLPSKGLPLYQAIVDHQVRVTDLNSMANKNATAIPASQLNLDPVTKQPKIDEVIQAIGEHPEIYPVNGGRLIMLVPSTLGVGYTKDIFDQGFKGVELTTTFSTKLQKIYDVLERVEFAFYATGKGDLLVEMPLHDFVPNDFGQSEVTSTELANVVGKDVAATLLSPNYPAGAFAPHYHVAANDTIKWSRTFNDEKVKTLATCTWYNIPALKEAGFGVDTGSKPARRLLDVLVPQFGVRHEPGEPTILVADERAAELYCQFLLNRNNGEARTVNVEVIPQLRVMPNRPLLFTERNYVGTVREVAHRITWGEKGDMTMSLKLNYIRGWDGSLEKDASGQPTIPAYSYLGGFRANFLNYALLFRTSEPSGSTQPLAPPNPGPPPVGPGSGD